MLNLVKDLFDLDRTHIISDFLNEDDTEVLSSQNWKLIKLEQILSGENDYVFEPATYIGLAPCLLQPRSGQKSSPSDTIRRQHQEIDEG